MLATLMLAAGALLAAQAPSSPHSAPDSPTRATPAGQPAAPAPVSTLGGSALAGWVVVLDPGHGGDDAGVGAGDLREAPWTLAVAQRTAAALTAQGARVLLTREADEGPDPDMRAATANRARGHVFISLHLNRSPRPAASGAEIYTHLGPTTGLPAGADAAGTSAPRLVLVPWDRVQGRHGPAAEALAAALETALGSRLPMSRHPRQRLPLRVLAGVDMPAVLLEVAYLSNPAQAAAVVTPAFQASVAEAITDALLQVRQAAGGPR
ncbi:MAG: N-acetylmuramoyl-L-alanine amidase [Vicinamibacterales bacterium]|nr:N-acetylmuramoyl-L-alanine amidase [Vicinamibacterales bacterium]